MLRVPAQPRGLAGAAGHAPGSSGSFPGLLARIILGLLMGAAASAGIKRYLDSRRPSLPEPEPGSAPGAGTAVIEAEIHNNGHSSRGLDSLDSFS